MEMAGQILRFGIMSDTGLRFSQWQAECIERLLAISNVRASLVIRNVTPVSSSVGARLKRAKPKLLLGQIYRNLISRPPCMREVDLSGRLRDIAAMDCRVLKRGRFSEYFADEDIATIRGHDLAFILRFGFNIIRGEILKSARYGVWSYHHGDEQKYRGVSEGFWEIYRGESVAGAILQRLTDTLDSGVILRKGHFAVVPHSWTQTRQRLYSQSARWPAQVCTDILKGVAAYADAEPSKSTAPIYYRPTNLQTVAMFAKQTRNLLRNLTDRAFVQTTWGLGVIRVPTERLLSSPQPAIDHVQGSFAPYRFLADPFILESGHRLRLLCEEFDQYAGGRGRIVETEISEGQLTTRPAIDLATHASYPCIVHHAGELFCVPEVPAAGRIVLYRQQGSQWLEDTVLVHNFAAADPTVFQHAGRWWLAACPIGEGQYHSLHLWYADDLRGPWRPHSANPVKMDVRSARSAGNPFVHADVLYRPAQDCSDGYGRRVIINAIDTLTPHEFREHPVATLEPDPHGPLPHGIHTLATAPGIAIVDGRRDFFDPFKQFKKQVLARILSRRAGRQG